MAFLVDSNISSDTSSSASSFTQVLPYKTKVSCDIKHPFKIKMPFQIKSLSKIKIPSRTKTPFKTKIIKDGALSLPDYVVTGCINKYAKARYGPYKSSQSRSYHTLVFLTAGHQEVPDQSSLPLPVWRSISSRGMNRSHRHPHRKPVKSANVRNVKLISRLQPNRYFCVGTYGGCAAQHGSKENMAGVAQKLYCKSINFQSKKWSADCILQAVRIPSPRHIRAKNKEALNTTRSRLHQLPAELLLSITSSLTATDILRLRMTCRKFWSMPGPTQISTGERRQLRGFLLRESFREGCRLERIRLMDEAMCRYCMTSQPRAMFSTAELKKKPQECACNICIGTKGLLVGCAHRSFTFAQVNRNHYEGCRSCKDHGGCLPIFFSCVGLGEVYCSRYRTLFSMKRSETITPRTVLNVLGGLYETACPHLQFTPATVDAFWDREFWHNTKRYAAETIDGEMAKDRVLSWDCSFQHCYTNVSILRQANERQKGLDEVICRIQRTLGQMLDPSDPVWLAQIVPPTRRKRVPSAGFNA